MIYYRLPSALSSFQIHQFAFLGVPAFYRPLKALAGVGLFAFGRYSSVFSDLPFYRFFLKFRQNHAFASDGFIVVLRRDDLLTQRLPRAFRQKPWFREPLTCETERAAGAELGAVALQDGRYAVFPFHASRLTVNTVYAPVPPVYISPLPGIARGWRGGTSFLPRLGRWPRDSHARARRFP